MPSGHPVIEILFPEFGNLAGDNGNASYLARCLPEAQIIETPSHAEPAFATRDVDLILMHNMMETQQERALARLAPHADRLAELADAGTHALFTGSASEIFGTTFQTMDGRTLPGLALFEFDHKQNMPKRYLDAFKGVFEPGDGAEPITILGFHAQFTQILGDNARCFFARAERGWGINTLTKLEGFRRGNMIATTLLGPLLTTNPDLCAWLLGRICSEPVPLAFEQTARRAFERRLREFDAAPKGKEIEF